MVAPHFGCTRNFAHCDCWPSIYGVALGNVCQPPDCAMPTSQFRYIGRGAYTLREAQRLTGVPVRRIRRWTTGYQYSKTGVRRQSPRVIETDLPEIFGAAAIDFADLLEVRFLNAFLEYGVSWRTIRIASGRAKELLDTDHPFSHRSFSTDGHTILTRIARSGSEPFLLDIISDQYELDRIVGSFLRSEIDFGDTNQPQRWYPLGNSRKSIVIDPARAFGQPILSRAGIPTATIARAAQSEGDASVVAQIYRLELSDVADALEYERSLVA